MLFNLNFKVLRRYRQIIGILIKYGFQDILSDAGKVSHEVALALAEKEYESFRKSQDTSYLSDFDHEMKRIQSIKKSS